MFIVWIVWCAFCMSSTVQAAGGAYVPGQLIVKFKSEKASSGITALSQTPATFKEVSSFLGARSITPVFNNVTTVRSGGGAYVQTEAALRKEALRKKIIRESGLENVYAISFDVSADILSIARQLQNDDAVEYAEPNYKAHMFKTPNDPRYSDGTEWHIDAISCPGGWDVTTGSSSIVVAVIDTGINIAHAEFAGRLKPGYNFINPVAVPEDDEGHGTFVSGIIGAKGDNGVGIAGIDWNVWLMPLKALDSSGEGTYTDITAAIYYAINNGADVINMSLGGSSSSTGLEQAIAAASRAQIVCVAAMGNDGDDTVYYPAGYGSVIRVGALSQNDDRASFSTYGSAPYITEISAPGTDIVSTVPGGYGVGDGTSFSAPMVSGLCSLVLSVQPTISVSELRILLHTTADDVGKSGPDKYCGFGRINVNNALKGITTQDKGEEITQLMNFPNPADDDGTNFSFFLDDPAAEITIKVFSTHGELIKTIDGGSSATAYRKVHWDCCDERGDMLPNGGYIYVVIAENGAHSKIFKKGKMAILR